MAKKQPSLVTLFLRRAKARKEDADVLFEAGRTTGAVYLAGYAVECGLKAVVLSLLPANQRPEQEAEFRGNRAHSFDWLRALGQTFGAPRPPAEVARAFTAVGDWTTALRYEPSPRFAESDDFFDAVAVIMQWVEQRVS